MRKLDSYLAEYAESHQHPLNVRLHNFCVPAILWSVLVFLSTITIPSVAVPKFSFGPIDVGPLPVRASEVFAFFALWFYFLISPTRVTAMMKLIFVVMIASAAVVPEARWVAIGVFVIAWIGQFYGHKIEGKKPSFLTDLLFLLIGPVWVLKKLFKKVTDKPRT
jgi:uncharacterized membrane protein YGL010W